MASIYMFKPLSTFLLPGPLINLSIIDNFSAEFFLGMLGIEPWGLLGEKQVRYATPGFISSLGWNRIEEFFAWGQIVFPLRHFPGKVSFTLNVVKVGI